MLRSRLAVATASAKRDSPWSSGCLPFDEGDGDAPCEVEAIGRRPGCEEESQVLVAA